MLRNTFFALSAFFLLVIPFQNCSKVSEKTPTYSPFSNAAQYFKIVNRINVEVYYEEGAEPYTGLSRNGNRNLWDIFGDNLREVFKFRTKPPEILFPTTLGEMYMMPNQNKESWRSKELLALNETYHQDLPRNKEARFYIYFLNGYYDNGSGPQQQVIGVNVSGTPIIAIFKPVVESGNNANGFVAKYIEQSTLVHEMGHALGFVNNGVPPISDHQDIENGSHTLNQDCVMYWLNEGMNDLALFVLNIVDSNSLILWGPEVLEDAKHFSN